MGKYQAIRRHEHQPEQHWHKHPKLERQTTAKPQRSISDPPKKLTIRSRSVRLFRRYPLLMLLAVWLLFASMAGLAILSMINLDASQRPQWATSSNPQIAETPLAPSPALPSIPSAKPFSDSSLPLVSLVAIILSCGTGCLVFLNLLKPRRSTQVRPSLTASRAALSNASAAKPNEKSGHPSQRRSSQNRIQTAQPQPAPAPETPISVVPDHIMHPLDWEEPSLADHLDLRQRRPLSYWL